MRFEGRALKLGDNVNTDHIIPFQYKARTLDPAELAKHVFEGLDPELPKRVGRDTIVVAGWNFGYGSSREQAPLAIKAAGVRVIIAKSFARIFYRNAVNLGLVLLEAPPDFIDTVEDGDRIVVDVGEGRVVDIDKRVEARVKPIPRFILEIVAAGGLAEYYRRHGRLPW